MNKVIRVLWVEDGARFELAYLTAPVYLESGYDISVAENPSEALEMLVRNRYDVLIVDIRLPPGNTQDWINLYKEITNQGKPANLGLKLLKSILKPREAEIPFNFKLDWLTPDKIGVFTIEGSQEVLESLKELGIHVIQQKTVTMPDTALLSLIKRLC